MPDTRFSKDDSDKDSYFQRRPRRRYCEFCSNKKKNFAKSIIDYKNLNTLGNYIDDRGKIDIRKRTGACAKCQRRIAQAIKRARHLALLPYTIEHIRLSGFSSSSSKKYS
jgi:small subunit ribosomal protein S18|tara:strand:+ start:208 stop:537 length:330 start_codon:yes stop_codon:yes gene_type:complete